jgi:hypothetical protein
MTFTLIAFLVICWCIFCVALTSRERLRLFDRLHDEPFPLRVHDRFWQVRGSEHLFRRLSLRSPWPLYPDEMKPK